MEPGVPAPPVTRPPPPGCWEKFKVHSTSLHSSVCKWNNNTPLDIALCLNLLFFTELHICCSYSSLARLSILLFGLSHCVVLYHQVIWPNAIQIGACQENQISRLTTGPAYIVGILLCHSLRGAPLMYTDTVVNRSILIM